MVGSKQWVRVYRLDRLCGVEIVHAHYREHRFARHAHEHFVVGLVEQGIQQYTYRGSRHTTPPGHLFFVNGDEPHTGESATADGYLYRTVCFAPETFRQLTLEITERNEVPYLKGSVIADGELFDRLRRLHEAVAANAPMLRSEISLFSAVRHLVEKHAENRRHAPAVGKENAVVNQVREYIEAHYAEDISLTQLACLTSRSPFHLARAFSKAVGLPPHAYLESMRIQRARELLKSGMSVVETALEIGYPDQSHFTHRFRRHTGITPGRYRGGALRSSTS
jgi:AraC-like DNA-binding protein